jgi:hypothetical protein
MSEHLQSYYEDFKSSITSPHGGVNTPLSTRGGKDVRLRQTREGETYVLRRYSPEAITGIAGRPRTFQRKLEEMQEAFGLNGIDLVQHLLIHDEESTSFPLAIVTEHIEKVNPLRHAHVSTKERVAKALGNLASDPDHQNDIFIGGTMIMPDMFHVGAAPDGAEQVTLIDIDPKVTEIGSLPGEVQTAMMAASVLQAAGVFWDSWVTEDERRLVLPALTKEVARGLDPDCDLDDELFRAVANVNLMDNGVDYRRLDFAL